MTRLPVEKAAYAAGYLDTSRAVIGIAVQSNGVRYPYIEIEADTFEDLETVLDHIEIEKFILYVTYKGIEMNKCSVSKEGIVDFLREAEPYIKGETKRKKIEAILEEFGEGQ